VHEVWPEIPAGHLEDASKALIARGASPVMGYEDCLKVGEFSTPVVPAEI
jgi:hypothetical protein